MKTGGLVAQKISEGKASLWVPKASFTDPHHCMVFYNPVMELSRSLSSAAFYALSKDMPANPKVLDGLCSTGARGVRYYLEGKKCRVTFNDANPQAIAFAKKNAKENKLAGAAFSTKNFYEEAAVANDYDFVELDPFGTPTIFLDSAVRACAKESILSVTATDLANLCGARPKPCIREYDAVPTRGYYCHETALRILIGRVARTCALHGRSFTPKVSYYLGHHAKTIGTVHTSALESDEMVRSIGMLGFCEKCSAFTERKAACRKCGEKISLYGPMWLGKIGDGAMLKAAKDKAQKNGFEKAAAILETVLSENDFTPGYIDIHELCSKARKPVTAKTDDLLSALRKAGYKAERTHFAPTGIKTDAEPAVVLGFSSQN